MDLEGRLEWRGYRNRLAQWQSEIEGAVDREKAFILFHLRVRQMLIRYLPLSKDVYVEVYPDLLVLGVRGRELAQEWKVRYSWWDGVELREVDVMIADLAVEFGLMYITS